MNRKPSAYRSRTAPRRHSTSPHPARRRYRLAEPALLGPVAPGQALSLPQRSRDAVQETAGIALESSARMLSTTWPRSFVGASIVTTVRPARVPRYSAASAWAVSSSRVEPNSGHDVKPAAHEIGCLECDGRALAGLSAAQDRQTRILSEQDVTLPGIQNKAGRSLRPGNRVFVLREMSAGVQRRSLSDERTQVGYLAPQRCFPGAHSTARR